MFGRGGGQCGFPALSAVVTAGLAQVGIVVFGGLVWGPHGRVGGEGGTQCTRIESIHMCCSNWDACCCVGGWRVRAVGSGAGGGSCRGTCCVTLSGWGSG